MIEDDRGLGRVGLQLESDDRVDAGVPGSRAPCLHDPLVGDELDISSFDQLPEGRKGAADSGVDLGRCTGERGELL